MSYTNVLDVSNLSFSLTATNGKIFKALLKVMAGLGQVRAHEASYILLNQKYFILRDHLDSKNSECLMVFICEIPTNYFVSFKLTPELSENDYYYCTLKLAPLTSMTALKADTISLSYDGDRPELYVKTGMNPSAYELLNISSKPQTYQQDDTWEVDPLDSQLTAPSKGLIENLKNCTQLNIYQRGVEIISAGKKVLLGDTTDLLFDIAIGKNQLKILQDILKLNESGTVQFYMHPKYRHLKLRVDPVSYGESWVYLFQKNLSRSLA